MTNKSISKGLCISMATAFITGFVSDSLTASTEGALTMLSGIGIVVFGIWAAHRLSK